MPLAPRSSPRYATKTVFSDCGIAKGGFAMCSKISALAVVLFGTVILLSGCHNSIGSLPLLSRFSRHNEEFVSAPPAAASPPATKLEDTSRQQLADESKALSDQFKVTATPEVEKYASFTDDSRRGTATIPAVEPSRAGQSSACASGCCPR